MAIFTVSDTALTPVRKHPTDAGIDLRLKENLVLAPGEVKTVSTGVCTAIPNGCFGMVAIRSGIASKYSVGLVNGIGVIDSDYRGEIGLTLINHGECHFEAFMGDRIAQILIIPCVISPVEIVESLDNTDRGTGGFGSTGIA